MSVDHEQINRSVTDLSGRVSALEAQGHSTQKELSEFKETSTKYRDENKENVTAIRDDITEIKVLLKFLRGMMKLAMGLVAFVGALFGIIKNWPPHG